MDRSEDIKKWWNEALEYHGQGDQYHSIKLLKLLLRHDESHGEALLLLGRIYKQRQEWKPAFFYLKKGVSLRPDDQDAWWDVGIAATALGKKRLARITWNKFGWNPDNPLTGGLISIRSTWRNGYEVLWGRRVSPALALIGSIPWPDSGLKFRDMILVDGRPSGWQVAGRKKYPVFDELGLHRRSDYLTWSCKISTSDEAHLSLLERLCREEGMGFENWSNASRQMNPERSGALPEYHHQPASTGDWPDGVVIALAARDQDEVEQVLTAWSIITFQDFSSLQPH